MPQDSYPPRSTVPEELVVRIRMLGTGAAAPTRVVGQGCTITRTSAGLYKLTFSESPGTFVSVGDLTLQAATPGDLKNHSVVADTWDSTARAIEVSLWDASGVAHDLAANEWITVSLVFRRTSVTG